MLHLNPVALEQTMMLPTIPSSRFHKAVLEVFGRTVLCRNIDIAREVGRGGQVDCVTLEGDQVSENKSEAGFYAQRL